MLSGAIGQNGETVRVTGINCRFDSSGANELSGFGGEVGRMGVRFVFTQFSIESS